MTAPSGSTTSRTINGLPIPSRSWCRSVADFRWSHKVTRHRRTHAPRAFRLWPTVPPGSGDGWQGGDRHRSLRVDSAYARWRQGNGAFERGRRTEKRLHLLRCEIPRSRRPRRAHRWRTPTLTITMNSQSARAIASTSKWRHRRFPTRAMIRLAAG